MTIKHLGGIFGRNPTFNDVTIDGGIYFEDGQSGNYLDDYEEGTWTPTVSSAAGTVTVTSTSGSTYTKIGRTVQVNASITMTTDASVGTSDLTIGGLPFAVVGGGTGNLSYSNWSSGDYGAGGAHGLVRLLGSNMFHVNRSIDISGRSSFGFIYYAVYTAS